MEDTERFIVVGMDFNKLLMDTALQINGAYLQFWDRTIDRFDYVGQWNKFMTAAVDKYVESFGPILSRMFMPKIPLVDTVRNMTDILIGKKDQNAV